MTSRFLAALVVAPFLLGAAAAPHDEVQVAFTFQDGEIVESSGLAVAGGLVATTNDSGLYPQAEGSRASAMLPHRDGFEKSLRMALDMAALREGVVAVALIHIGGYATYQRVFDSALANKLLRLVNTVSYSHAGGGSISTVSRAVALIGFAGVRNLALSLVLLEHMQDKAHATRLREEFLRALMAGALARELTPIARETEEAFIGAMFQNLGRLLTEFYFPEEARQVRGMVDAAEAWSL